MDKLCNFIYYNPEELQPTVYRVLIALHLVTTPVSTVLNFIILRAIWKTPSLHKPSMVLSFGLAVSDVCMGTAAQPLTVAYLLTMQIKGTFQMHCILAILSQSIVTGLSGIFGLTLIMMSIDRFLAIKMKTTYKTLVTVKRVIISITLIWVICFVVGTVLIVIGSLKVIFMTVAFLGGVMLMIVIFINAMAFRTLQKISLNSAANTKSKKSKKKFIDVPSFRHTLWTILIILTLITLLFMHYIINGVVYWNNPVVDSPQQNASYNIGVFLMSLHSLANPFVYLWRMRKIRDAVKNMIKINCSRRTNKISENIPQGT